MEEQKISFEVAKLAKEKGFKDFTTPFCFHEDKEVWCNTIDVIKSKRIFAPTQSILQRWLREVHNIDIIIWKNGIDGSYRVEDILLNNKELTNLEFEDSFDTYENALEEGLYEALKLIKDET